MNLHVGFDHNGCLKVPEVSSNLNERALNPDLLSEFGQLLRDAQTKLDRIPTTVIGMENFVEAKGNPGTTDAEYAVFERLRELNAEVVLRILVMRRLIVAAQTGR